MDPLYVLAVFLNQKDRAIEHFNADNVGIGFQVN